MAPHFLRVKANILTMAYKIIIFIPLFLIWPYFLLFFLIEFVLFILSSLLLNMTDIALVCILSVPSDNNAFPSVIKLLQLQILTQMSTFQSGPCWLPYLKLQLPPPLFQLSQSLILLYFLPCTYNLITNSIICLHIMFTIYWQPWSTLPHHY